MCFRLFRRCWKSEQASDNNQWFHPWPSYSSWCGQPGCALATGIRDRSRRPWIIRSVRTFIWCNYSGMSWTQEKWFPPQRHGQPKDYRWSTEWWLCVVRSVACATFHPGLLFTGSVLPGRQEEPREPHSHGVHATRRSVESARDALIGSVSVLVPKQLFVKWGKNSRYL